MRLVLVSGFQGFGRGSLGGGQSSGGGFGFTLAATHFTRVVRRTAVRQHDGGRLDRCLLGNHGWRRLGHRGFDRFRLGFDGFSYRGRLFGDWRLGFNRFGNRCLLDLARFHYWGLHDRGRLDRCLDNGGGRLLGGGFFDHRLWRHFNDRLDARLGSDHWLADRLLDHRGDGDLLGHDFGDLHLGLGDSGAGAFGLLVGLGLGVGADVAGGNGSDHGCTGGQFSTQLGGLVLLWLLFAGVFVAAVDQLAIGVALALTTVAATTLATGTAAWTLAIGAFLLVL